jgi:hypothetical protein
MVLGRDGNVVMTISSTALPHSWESLGVPDCSDSLDGPAQPPILHLFPELKCDASTRENLNDLRGSHRAGKEVRKDSHTVARSFIRTLGVTQIDEDHA